MIVVSRFTAGLNSLNLFTPKTIFLVEFMGSCLFGSMSASAAIIENQPFDFGTWAITTNTGFQTITVNPNGTFSSSPGLINIIVAPLPGIYTVDSLPPSTAINSVNATELLPMTGGNPDFNLIAFQVVYDPVTDVNGEMGITLGATARTTGTGVPYDDAVYTGTIELEINY